MPRSNPQPTDHAESWRMAAKPALLGGFTGGVALVAAVAGFGLLYGATLGRRIHVTATRFPTPRLVTALNSQDKATPSPTAAARDARIARAMREIVAEGASR